MVIPPLQSVTKVQSTPRFSRRVGVPDDARQVYRNKYVALYQSPPTGERPYPWYFFHRPPLWNPQTSRYDKHIKGAVHALTIVTNDRDEQFVHLLVTMRPPLGQKCIELPAGLWGDQEASETALTASTREVKEETGLTVDRTRLLSKLMFATSPGITTERKAFALAYAHGNPSQQFLERSEQGIVLGSINVPVGIFADSNRFVKWLDRVHKKGYLVGMDVLAARALMPSNIAEK